MSDEVDWVLAQLQSVVDSVDTDYGVPLKRVNRDESEILEDNLRALSGELRDGCFVGATLADVSQEPIGTEYDLRREAVVGLRLVGLHESEYGYVDPDGTNGIPWDVLVDRVRGALYDQRTYPDAGAPTVTYTDLRLTNEAPGSSDYEDYYRWDVDVLFRGYEDLS